MKIHNKIRINKMSLIIIRSNKTISFVDPNYLIHQGSKLTTSAVSLCFILPKPLILRLVKDEPVIYRTV